MMKKITNMKNNIIDSWKTTLVGSVILLAALVSVFVVENIVWSDIYIALAMGIALLFSPDTLINKISKLLTKKDCNE